MNGIDISSSRVIALMAAIAVTIAAIGIATGHGTAEGSHMMNGDEMTMMHSHSMMMGMMDNDMSMHQMGGMHMMEGEMGMHEGMTGMMKCMQMMGDAISDGTITAEEMEKMMQEMDTDGDGICDYCGMSIEACREMMLHAAGVQ